MEQEQHDVPADREAGAGGSILARWRASGRRIAGARLTRMLLPPAAVGALALAMAVQFAYTQHASVDGLWRGFAIAAAVFGGVALLLSLSRHDDDIAAGRGADAADAGILLSRRMELVLLAAIIILAAFFRFYRISSFPPGIWFDEGVVGTDAVSLIEGDHFTIWKEANYGKATPYLYLVAGSIQLFGHTAFALRFVPAVAGIAAVVVFYFLARRLVGVGPALLATALLATSRWAVTFSRISWDAAMVPLMATASMFFLLKALDTRDRRWFLLAGGTLSAGLYTYVSFRIVPVVIAALLLYACITEWRTIRANIGGLALYVLAAAAVIAPLAHFTATHPDLVLKRTREVNVFRQIEAQDSWEPLRLNIEKSIEMLNVKGDPNSRHNIPHEPMVDEITGALFVLGLAVSVASFWRWRRGGMALWYVAALTPGAFSLMQDNPSAIRDVGALPPIYLLAGLALATLHGALAPLRFGAAAFAVLGASLVAASGAINYYDFFERQAHDQRVYHGFTPWLQDVGETVADGSDEAAFHVSHAFAGEPPLTLLTHDVAFEPYNAGTHLIFPRDDRPHTIIADERQFAILPTLRRLYPNLAQDDWVDPWGRRPFTRITLPVDDLAALHELPLTIVRASGTEQTRDRVDRVWTEADVADGPITAMWEGYFWATGEHSRTAFFATSPGTISMTIDGGEPITSTTGDLAPTPFEWSAGEHRIRIEARIERPGAVAFTTPQAPVGATSGADALYRTSLGDHGMLVLYRQNEDYAEDPIIRSRVPFALPVAPFGSAGVIEYQGLFDVVAPGQYRFALDGLTSQLLIDGQLIVDNGGLHAPQRAEGAVELTRGEHFVSLQFIVGAEPTLAVFMMPPGADWALVDGSEFRVPPADYRPRGLVRLIRDESWGPGGVRRIDVGGELRAIDVLPDGRLAIATEDAIAIVDPGTGEVVRRLDGVATGIRDIAALSDGGIAVADGESRSLVILNGDGGVRARHDDLQGAHGVAVAGGQIYVASPSGGAIYRVPSAGGSVETIDLEEVRQPSDVAVSSGGALFIADFDSKQILRSDDGLRVNATYVGVPGTGDALPHLALFGDLLLVSDMIARRIVIYDTETGAQRGGFVFDRAANAAPAGLAATADGRVYVVDGEDGTIYRLRIEAPADAPPRADALWGAGALLPRHRRRPLVLVHKPERRIRRQPRV